MAKATVSKSTAIREALAANPDKGPAELAVILKGKGVDVTPAYISVIKSSLKKLKGPGRTKGRARVALRRGGQIDAVRAAAEFVKTVGGIEAAKAALTTVETISDMLG